MVTAVASYPIAVERTAIKERAVPEAGAGRAPASGTAGKVARTAVTVCGLARAWAAEARAVCRAAALASAACWAVRSAARVVLAALVWVVRSSAAAVQFMLQQSVAGLPRLFKPRDRIVENQKQSLTPKGPGGPT